MSPPQSRANSRDTVLVIALTALLSFCFLGSRPFSTRGEPREALVAQAMLESGNYLLGSGYGGVVPSKPPFMHWLIAGFSKIPGEVTEWTSRAPSAVASFAFLLAWFGFLRRRIGSPQALFATLLLATSIEWYRAASTTRVDMTLAALLGFSFIGLYGWWERKLLGVPFWTILALWGATLTKGPVAIALPGAIFGLFLLLQGERVGRVIGKSLVVFVPALCGALLWYLAAYLERGPEFFHKVYYENFARLTSTQEDSPHKHSAFYLVGTIFLGLMPWTFLVLPLAWQWTLSLGRPRSLRGALVTIRQRFQSATPLAQFAVLASVVFIVFFSIPSGKRSVYLLPVYPFLALGLAQFLSRIQYQQLASTRIIIRGLSLILLSVGLVIGAAVSNLPATATLLGRYVGAEQAADTLEVLTRFSLAGASVPSLMLCVLACSLLCGAIMTRRIVQSQLGVAALFSAILIAATGSIIVLISQQTTAKSFAPQVAALVPAHTPLYSYGNEFYGLSFYLKREIRSLQSNSAPEPGSFVVLYEGNVAALTAALPPGSSLVATSRSPNSVDKLGEPLLLFKVQPRPPAM